MNTIKLQEKLHGYRRWREELVRALDSLERWLDAYGEAGEGMHETIRNIRGNLRSDRLLVAFVAEFSRGKTELINALFFSDTGVRLLPSLPGRTTMCPTEIFYDPTEEGAYIRLLPIETRLSEITLNEHRQNPDGWFHIELDPTSPAQMQDAFQELASVKKVSREDAVNLGLFNEELYRPSSAGQPETVEVPRWRHALISFPHKLLKEGLSILDTPGLNALGAEPELTLRMLPSAQAIIFVLAADTGVTKSDLDIWSQHVRGPRHARRKGLAVALNKIDSLWDDLEGDDATQRSIRSQATEASRILGLDVNLIFPVSAKQALLAKVKGDDALLKKSRLLGIEDYLTGAVIRDRQFLLQETVNATVGHGIHATLNNLGSEIVDAQDQLKEMRGIDVENQEMTRRLMEETRLQQTRYIAGVENFQSGRKVFMVQVKLLMEALSLATVNPILRNAHKTMVASLTTMGMKEAMKTALDDLLTAMEKALALAEEARRLVKALYSRFDGELGFDGLKPSPFSLKKYQIELEKICEEGEEFRQSASATLMEQNAVVHKLFSTIIAEACGLFARAHEDSSIWGQNALNPLAGRLKDRKRMIDARLEVLRKVNESSETLDTEIAELEKRMPPLLRQYGELEDIRRILAPEYASPVFEP